MTTADGNRTITITGSVRNSYEENRNNSRAARPSYVYSDKRYVITATATDGSSTTGSGNTTDDTFSIPLTLGKVWTITVKLEKKETDANNNITYVKVMDGSYTFPAALTEVNTGISIEIRPCITANGTGKIDLDFATPPGDLYDSVTAEPISDEQKAVWNATVTTSASGITMKPDRMVNHVSCPAAFTRSR